MDDQDDRDPSETILEDEDAPQPEVARIRRKVRSAGRDGRVRSKTIAPKRLTRDERRLADLLVKKFRIDSGSALHEVEHFVAAICTGCDGEHHHGH